MRVIFYVLVTIPMMFMAAWLFGFVFEHAHFVLDFIAALVCGWTIVTLALDLVDRVADRNGVL